MPTKKNKKSKRQRFIEKMLWPEAYQNRKIIRHNIQASLGYMSDPIPTAYGKMILSILNGPKAYSELKRINRYTCAKILHYSPDLDRVELEVPFSFSQL